VFVSHQYYHGALPVSDEGIARFGPLAPGEYRVTAISDGTSPRLAAFTHIDVQNQPVEATLLMQPGARLTGRVEFDGLQRPLHSALPLQVSIKSSWSSNDTNGRVGAERSFVLDGLVGEHCLLLHGIPFGWELRSITHQNRDVTRIPMSFEVGQDVGDIVFRVFPGEPSSGTQRCASGH